jgi:hypothetical protein
MNSKSERKKKKRDMGNYMKEVKYKRMHLSTAR